jgi:hypothetical protein
MNTESKNGCQHVWHILSVDIVDYDLTVIKACCTKCLVLISRKGVWENEELIE